MKRREGGQTPLGGHGVRVTGNSEVTLGAPMCAITSRSVTIPESAGPFPIPSLRVRNPGGGPIGGQDSDGVSVPVRFLAQNCPAMQERAVLWLALILFHQVRLDFVAVWCLSVRFLPLSTNLYLCPSQKTGHQSRQEQEFVLSANTSGRKRALRNKAGNSGFGDSG